jgi:pyruvate kinase
MPALIRAGLNVARLNSSHGDFVDHAERISSGADSQLLRESGFEAD